MILRLLVAPFLFAVAALPLIGTVEQPPSRIVEPAPVAPRLDLRGNAVWWGPSGTLLNVEGIGGRQGFRPRAMASVDTEGRREPRLAVADDATDRIFVYRAEAGRLVLEAELRAPAGPRALLAADLDGDGRDDLLAAGALAGAVAPFLSRGGGAFEAVAPFHVGELPVSLRLERSPEAADPTLVVGFADGSTARFRSLGAGRFDSVMTRTGDACTQPDAGAVSASAPLVNAPPVDFEALRTCVSALPISAAGLKKSLKSVDKAESAYAKAAAGTKPSKFAKPVAALEGYIDRIQLEVGVTIDQPAADACIDPARSGADALLLVGVASDLVAAGGGGQTGRPFETLNTPLLVRVEDVYANPVPGVAVAFAVTSGGGSLSPVSPVTDRTGTASTRLTLPDSDSDITIAASVTGLGSVPFTATAETGTISLGSDVQPIFTSNCALSGCHLGASGQEGMSLAAGNLFNPDSGIVNVPSSQSPLLRVKPFDPDGSYLLHKLDGTQDAVGGGGDRMPRGRSPLPISRRFLIRAWIQQGAANN